MGTFNFLHIPMLFRMRSCGEPGSDKRTRDPAGPDRICCVAGIVRKYWFPNVFNVFWETVNGFRPLSHGNENAPQETLRRLMGSFIFLHFPMAFRMLSCGEPGSDKRTRDPAGPDRIFCVAGIVRKYWFSKCFPTFFGKR